MQKTFIILAFIIIALSARAQVQRKAPVANDSIANGSKGAVNKKTKKRQLLLELNLSKEQKMQVKEIFQTNKSRRAEIMNDETLTDVQKQVRLKQMRTTTAVTLQGILSVEQKEKLKALQRDVNNQGKSEAVDNEEKDF